jgi:hypothetical protein
MYVVSKSITGMLSAMSTAGSKRSGSGIRLLSWCVSSIPGPKRRGLAESRLLRSGSGRNFLQRRFKPCQTVLKALVLVLQSGDLFLLFLHFVQEHGIKDLILHSLNLSIGTVRSNSLAPTTATSVRYSLSDRISST